MKDNKDITIEAVGSTAAKEHEVKVPASAPTYDPDDYINKHYLYDDMFYYNANCFSCKHWLRFGCGAPNGPCNYESP